MKEFDLRYSRHFVSGTTHVHEHYDLIIDDEEVFTELSFEDLENLQGVIEIAKKERKALDESAKK